MESLSQSRLASVLTLAVGVWLLLSPIFISITGGALTNILIVGAVITLAGLVQLVWTNSTLPSWISAIAAIWLFIAAFAFNVSNAVVWNEVISAIIVFILATWDGVEISQVQEHREHPGRV